MDAIDQLRVDIPQFPGYADEGARRLCDELIRSFVGEALARMEARLGVTDPRLCERFGALLLRAGFTNQSAFRGYEYVELSSLQVDQIAQADLALVILAQAADGTSAADASAYLDRIVAAFDARDSAMQQIAA